MSSLLFDLDTVRRVGPTIGLVLNEAKCEIITNDDNMVASFRAAMPNIRHIPSDGVIMLRAPVGSESSVEIVLNDKLAAFRLLASRLTSLSSSRCSVPFEKLFQYTEVIIHAPMCSLLQERRIIRIRRRHSRHSQNSAECRFNR